MRRFHGVGTLLGMDGGLLIGGVSVAKRRTPCQPARRIGDSRTSRAFNYRNISGTAHQRDNPTSRAGCHSVAMTDLQHSQPGWRRRVQGKAIRCCLSPRRGPYRVRRNPDSADYIDVGLGLNAKTTGSDGRGGSVSSGACV